jgi:hypothetical protein
VPATLRYVGQNQGCVIVKTNAEDGRNKWATTRTNPIRRGTFISVMFATARENSPGS